LESECLQHFVWFLLTLLYDCSSDGLRWLAPSLLPLLLDHSESRTRRRELKKEPSGVRHSLASPILGRPPFVKHPSSTGYGNSPIFRWDSSSTGFPRPLSDGPQRPRIAQPPWQIGPPVPPNSPSPRDLRLTRLSAVFARHFPFFETYADPRHQAEGHWKNRNPLLRCWFPIRQFPNFPSFVPDQTVSVATQSFYGRSVPPFWSFVEKSRSFSRLFRTDRLRSLGQLPFLRVPLRRDGLSRRLEADDSPSFKNHALRYFQFYINVPMPLSAKLFGPLMSAPFSQSWGRESSPNCHRTAGESAPFFCSV